MDFSLTEEQILLRDSVARFCRDQVDVAQWRRLNTGEAELPEEGWRQIAAMGWLGLAVPESLGGLGGGPVEVMLLAEGLGRGLVAQPVIETAVLSARLLAQCSRREELALLMEGGLRLALAAVETGQRFALQRVETRARRAGAGWVVEGAKSFVPAGNSAHAFILTTMTEAGFSLFLLPAAAAGLQRADYVTADGRRASTLRLDGVALPESALLGTEGQGWPLLEEAVDRTIAALCAEAVGAMEVLHETTVEYLKQRRQFGRALADFQALQHRLADMYVACEEARSLLLLATLRLEDAPRERVRAVSAAKARIGQNARFIAHQAIQLHGAMGMCEEVAVAHYAKRLLAIYALFGGAYFHTRGCAAAG